MEDNNITKPTIEQAEFLFKKFPNKKLRDWADEWGMSHENVRLMKKKLGLPTRTTPINNMVADEIIAFIKDEKGTVNTARTYANYPFGKGKFLYWLDENPQYKDILKEAEAIAEEKKKNPTHKRCIVTGEWLPVSEFYKDKGTVDGYSRRSKKAVQSMVKEYYYKRNVTEPVVEKKQCSALPELGELPAENFHRNRRLTSGLQQYSIAFQTAYSANLNSANPEVRKNAHGLAKKEALKYFATLGYTPKS